MARQVEEGGWPLGLQQPLGVRAAASFSNLQLLTASPSSLSHSSSDFDTESSGSFFPDRSSTTLGNLMGVSSIVELSRRGAKINMMSSSQTLSLQTKNKSKKPAWCFCICLCQRDNDDVVNNDEDSNNNVVPLARFLEVERRAAQDHRRGQHSPLVYGADELTLAQPFRDSSNSLFMDGQIMPPVRSSPCASNLAANERRKGRLFVSPCF